MDRLTATSMAPQPDWPLLSLPNASLTNVPKANKRHGRLFSDGMVNLKLTQMADHERQKIYPEEQKQLDYKIVQLTEHEFEKWVFERKRMQKREKIQEKKKKRISEPNSFDEMIDAVDTLMSSPISPTEIMKPRKRSIATAAEIEQFHFPTPHVIEIAELDACETAITTTPPPSTSSPAECDNSNNESLELEEASEPTTHPITLTTALHSNLATASERTFARNLSSARHARLMTVNAIMMGQDSLATFDAVTEYGQGVKKTTMKMSSFGKAVQKGFRGFFGEERGW